MGDELDIVLNFVLVAATIALIFFIMVGITTTVKFVLPKPCNEYAKTEYEIGAVPIRCKQ